MSAVSLSVEEVSRVLGINRATLYRRLAAGNAPPSFSWEGRRLFPVKELHEWLSERLAEAKGERPRFRAERPMTRMRELALRREAEATMRPRRVDQFVRIEQAEKLLAEQRAAIRSSLERLMGPAQARGVLRAIARDAGAPEGLWLAA